MKKNFNIKSMVIGIIIGSLLLGGVVGAATLVYENVYYNSYPIVLNGNYYTSSSPLLNFSNKTYVPLNELATITGSSVNFVNGTIYINSSANSNPNIYNPTISSNIDLDEDDTESIYINLNKYNAQNATITTNSSAIKLSQNVLTYSGLVTITGKSDGKATITVRYNTGNVEYIYVTVDGNDNDYDMEIDLGDYDYIEIDLDDYDADKATLSIAKGSSYISLNKTSLTSSGKVKVTGKKEGEATIKIKYDSNETEYIYVTVTDDDDNDEDMEIDVGDYDYIEIDLDDYDADKATLSITKGSSFISLNKTSLTSSGKVKVTGKKEGEATIKIKYDSNETEYVFVTVTDDDNDDDDYDYSDFTYIEELNIDVDDDDYFYVNLTNRSATSAEISVISGSSYVTLNKDHLTASGNVFVYGDDEGESIIKIKYNTGYAEYVYVDVD